jgi:SAM-dependent methyltransferase
VVLDGFNGLMQPADTAIVELLREFARRPPPFSRYTAPAFWSDPHIAGEMLKWHLDPDTDRASYRPERIDLAVRWLHDLRSLEGKRVCDLGCGPGLYASRICDLGASVTGMDVSAGSLAYAAAEARATGRVIDYRRGDYTVDPLPAGQDLVIMISRDLGVLAPEQRRVLLRRIQASLHPGGAFVFDVSGLPELEAFVEEDRIETNLMNGFWAPLPYLGLKKSFRYRSERLSLERYLIFREAGTYEAFNWLQYFTPDTLWQDLAEAGFGAMRCYRDFGGPEWSEEDPAVVVVAKKDK